MYIIRNSRYSAFPLRLVVICVMVLSVSAQTKPVDLAIINASVHTVDPELPIAEAIGVTGNRISVVGTNAEIKKLVGENTKVIDAEGKLLIPGFNDAHVHFDGIGNIFTTIDLRAAKSAEEAAGKIKYYVKFLPKGRWILGGQWNHENWSPNGLPTKELLDAVAPDNPVFIYNQAATMVWVNSLALKIANVDKDRKDIAGGLIVRDETGAPTGILRGNAIYFVKPHMPKIPSANILEVIETATNYAASLGVTSVQDMHSDYLGEVLSQLDSAGKLKTRVYDCAPLRDWEKIAAGNKKAPSVDSLIRSGCLKSYVESSPDSIPALFADILGADRAGLQIMIHAIGAGANENIFAVFDQVARLNGSRDRRFRIEHATGYRQKELPHFAASEIIPSIQPHLFSGRDPYRSLMKSGAKIAFGSDASITDFNPMFGIYDAVKPRNPEEALTAAEAVYFYTMGSAYAEFQENEKGSITVGKLADFVLLSDNIFEIDPEGIRSTRVLMTVVDGKIVYESDK